MIDFKHIEALAIFALYWAGVRSCNFAYTYITYGSRTHATEARYVSLGSRQFNRFFLAGR
jgi:hypothetical protein